MALALVGAGVGRVGLLVGEGVSLNVGALVALGKQTFGSFVGSQMPHFIVVFLYLAVVAHQNLPVKLRAVVPGGRRGS